MTAFRDLFPARFHWIFYPASLLGFYILWILSFRLFTLSIITYIAGSPGTHFQEISDTFSSNEITLMGLASLLFVILLIALNPLTLTKSKELISRKHIEAFFIPGFLRGSVFAGSIVFILMISGTYRYLGYFIQLGDTTTEVLNLLLRIITLGLLAYCEEFIFHFKLSHFLKDHLPHFACANLIALAYCGTKLIQFDLGIMQFLTLYGVSLALFYKVKEDKGFARTAGFLAAIFILFQPLLSLPIFGNDFPGLLLIKYQNPTQSSKILVDQSTSLTRLLTGGLGGPFSSFAFQLFLILDISKSILQSVKKPEKERTKNHAFSTSQSNGPI